MQLRLIAPSPRMTKLLVRPEYIKTSEYDREIPQSNDEDEPTAT